MEETALLTACAINLGTSGSVPDREASVYYWLGLAHERLAQQLSVEGVDVCQHHHTVHTRRLTDRYTETLAHLCTHTHSHTHTERERERERHTHTHTRARTHTHTHACMPAPLRMRAEMVSLTKCGSDRENGSRIMRTRQPARSQHASGRARSMSCCTFGGAGSSSFSPAPLPQSCDACRA